MILHDLSSSSQDSSFLITAWSLGGLLQFRQRKAPPPPSPPSPPSPFDQTWRSRPIVWRSMWDIMGYESSNVMVNK